MDRPNLLLILTDQQSGDAMSSQIGKDVLSTPNLDRLAQEGLLFRKAYCPHPLCVPSRASMFSGRYPHETGVMTNADVKRDLSAFPCLGATFRDAGYDTGFVGKWHMPYPIDDEAAHGFRYRANNRSNRADLENVNSASAFFRERGQEPFLLVVSFNNPHNICEWARGVRGELPDGRIDEPPSLDELPPLRANAAPQADEPDAVSLLRRSYHASPTFPVGEYGEREWREYQWAYYRMVEWIDLRIGELLDALAQAGLRESTAVVFLSDHGDMQGAHRWNQKTTLYDESARVPCIVSHPGRVAPGVSDALIQTGVDLAPTLFDLAGIEAPEALPGESMLSLAAKAASGEGRPYVVTETKFVQGAEVDGRKPEVEGRMVRSENFKYCLYDAGQRRESLVDMEADPGETKNLAGSSAAQPELERHRDYMSSFAKSTKDRFPLEA